MLKPTVTILSIFSLCTAVSGCLYKGVYQEARDYKTPPPVPTQEFINEPIFPQWIDSDEQYRFYPGDEVEINVLAAPELSKTAIIAPDGRIKPNLANSIMAADKTPDEVQQLIEMQYKSQLRNPQVNISPKSFASQKIFVGGEVAKPGIYELNAEIDPIQAIILAGGFLNSAKREDVVVLRRGVGGQPFMRTFDLKTVFSNENALNQLPRLRRLDVIWVPKSRVSEVGLFTQQFIREALPVTIGFNYSINAGRRY